MILPSKHLPQERALLTVGGQLLAFLAHPKTVSALWEDLSKQDASQPLTRTKKISYDWFLLALDLLYALGAIELDGGLVKRSKP